MQPNNIKNICNKEISIFFASPIAYLFLATFAAITLFTFFWGEAFFSRNIADVRPLFEWMPILLIFLGSTLTMRLWSEERRTGTLEHILTQPVPLWHFVVGKFFSCLILLAIALIITLPLPITVSIIGELDWGPVWSGYLATFLLGATYLSIGLFISARSENQIVSLISAVLLSGCFYLIGTSTITNFFGNTGGEILRLIGSGSRFESITRGVIDFRDLYYYLSIIGVFLTLNTLILEKERWAKRLQAKNHRNWQVISLLLIINAVSANFWLGQIDSLRVDTTQGNQYSISKATHNYLDQLQEPLLVRGYFSSKTHPLLAPLVPQLKNLIEEYEIAGRGKVRVEFIDPMANPELEEEANKKYAIQPVPFQVADRYQSAIVSSYFNVLIQYGDEHRVLGFRDLIEVKATADTNIDVQLRNPEHDLTRAIKKVLNNYQSSGNLFDTLSGELLFNAYISNPSRLPEQLVEFKNDINNVISPIKKQAGDRLTVNFIEPEANNNQIAKELAEKYGFQPMAVNLFSKDRFYFYLTLSKNQQVIQIPLDDLTEASFKKNLESGIKRFASGFTKTIALVTPPSNPAMAQYGMRGPQFNQLQTMLSEEYNVINEDLGDGKVSGDADLLILASPQNLDNKQLYAVDQFLMQGGTVIASTSPYSASFSGKRLSMQPKNSGIEKWLSHHGMNIENKLVMDPQNSSFPVPVTRNVGGLQFQEMRMLKYPYFVDIRGDSLNPDNPITANIPQATFAWGSPIKIDSDKQQNRKITTLLKSSSLSWLSTSTNVMPILDASGRGQFSPQGAQAPHLLGVINEGRFNSYFSGKQSPLLSNDKKADDKQDQEKLTTGDKENDQDSQIISGVIERSPESARIILFSSNDFLRDQVVQMTSSAKGGEYLATLQLLANSVDWSLEDAGLLSIRSRGHFNRTLPPMEKNTQLFWEYLNYVFAIFLLVVIALIQRQRKKLRQLAYVQLLSN